ncbi:MAG: hypothetical protein LAO09_02755 [Acidobacteriia bacterium]|nr:hypothetical protein [Terriglobia bacterium]
MTDQQARNDVASLKKSLTESDDRTLRLGDKLEKLKDSAQEFSIRVARVEERTSMLLWAFGIGIAVLLAFGTQLYLMNGRVFALDENVKQVAAGVSAIRLTQLSAEPTKAENISQTQKVLQQAIAGKIKIDQEVVRNTGINFMQASYTADGKTNPAVWPAVQQYLNYKAFLNRDVEASLGNLEVTTKGYSKYRETVTIIPVEKPPHHPFGVFYAGGHVDPAHAARLEPLDSPQTEPNDIKYYIIQIMSRDIVVLDNMWMKNVIIRDGTVQYGGGRIVLDSVYFVNCKFNLFQLTPRSKDLGEAILASTPTTFNANVNAKLLGKSN